MSGSAVQAGKRATYPAYKPSGTPWLGDVPEHWEVRRMKYSADLINQKVDGAVADLPYMGLEHIESWTGKRLGQNGDASSDGQANLFRRGDVLFGKLRPYLAKAYAADSEGICTGELLVLRPKAVEQRFLLDYVLNPDFVTIVDSSTYGAKMPRANWDFIGNLPTLIPPLDEQRAIAAFLDRETARIDALIEKKRRQIELLQEKRSALISHAVTKGLDPNAPTKDSGYPGWQSVPAHWHVTQLRHLTQPGRAIMYGIVLPGPHVEDGVPIVKGGNCEPGRLRLDEMSRTTHEIESRYERSRLRPGDIVYAIRGSIGEADVVPPELDGANMTQDAARIAPLPDVNNRWLVFALRSYAFFSHLDAHATGATIRGINIWDLKRAPICVPPLSEQRGIAAYLMRETTQHDKLTAKLNKSICQLREFRSALISAAVTGKIDVRGEVV